MTNNKQAQMLTADTALQVEQMSLSGKKIGDFPSGFWSNHRGMLDCV